ncbi:DUF7507 domain-containing protein [Winogradskyella endarachnes]|nr:Ig-like domain-containing protein [Winogradskyella endarachnes]
MRKKYNCVSVINITRAVILAFFVVLSNLLVAQQSPSIQTGVTFQWLEATQPDGTYPATIKSITIDGELYNTFVVPTDYEMTRVGPNGDSYNHINENSTTIFNDSSNPLWHDAALSAFQDKNLNHFFSCSKNGRNICQNFDGVAYTDAQKQTIFYNPSIPANEGGVLAITERNANNCYHIAVYGTPMGGGTETFLGETFVRANYSTINGTYQPPNQTPNPGTDYWLTDRTVEQNKTIGMALFYLSDIVPLGSKITKIEFNASTNDHGDGKFLILQKYAVDNHEVNCINETYNGDLKLTNNAPENSTFSLVSAPTTAGAFFELNTDGTYTYEPNPGFTGEVSFEYSVCLPAPNESVCDQATVYLNFVDLPPDPTYQIDCNTDGTFNIEVTSPLGAEYEYKLNSGDYQSSPIFNVPAGSYNLKLKNINSNCEKIYSNNPIQLSSIKITSEITDVSCKLGNDGAIDVTVTGGTPPYTYNWSNSSTTQDINNLYAGSYTITVTDANGCTKDQVFEIEQPNEELAVVVDWIKHVDCYGNDSGDFKVIGSGGTPPYLYSVDGGTTTQTSDFFAPPFSAGNYTVTIIDALDCTSTVDLEITQPDEIIINVVSTTDILCYGDATGAISIDVWGGIGNLTYAWSNGSTDQNLSNLTAGTYTVTVTDDNGCTDTESITLTQPNEALSTNLIYNTSVLCFGESTGKIKYEVSGGTAPYQYSLDNGTTLQSNNYFENLATGNYTYTVIDANDCIVTVDFTITQPSAALSVSIDKVNATSAQGCDDGSATANPSGGTAPYTYLWSAGNQTTATISNLAIGTYSVTITDANNCETIQTVDITCTDDCDTATTSGTITDVLCYGEATGEATVSASSAINPNATYTFTWSNGQVDTNVASSTISNVSAGNYSVSVAMDGSSCDPVVHNIQISQPSQALSGSINSQSNIICSGLGSITISGIGGTAPYTYSKDAGANYQNDGIFSDLDPGNYTFTILDANNCSTTITSEILINCTDAIADINNTFVDQSVTGNVLTNDEDLEGDIQTVTANTNPSNGSVTINPNGTYTYIPNSGFIGEDTFEYTICDDGNPQACDSAIAYIEILPESEDDNEAPIANADTATTPEATPIEIAILSNDFDQDGDSINITGTTNPANGSITVNPNNTITYIPNPGFSGEDTFTYTICDDATPQLCDTATVTITVQDSSTPNTTNANDDAYYVNPTSILTGNVLSNDNDIEGDIQTVISTSVISTQGVVVNINANTGEFSYTPNAGYTGTDSFIYSLSDNGTPNALDEATVYITLDGVAGLSIVKTATSAVTDCVTAEDEVTYTFTVTNTGDVLINSITITDDLLGGDITSSLSLVGDDNNDSVLDPTETWVFTAPNYTITQADVDAGHITNNVTASGLEPDGTTTVQANDTYIIDANNTEVTLCSDGGINIVKAASTATAGCVGEGDEITYSFTVTNSGNVSINTITITDDLLGGDITSTLSLVGDDNNDSILDPTETWVFTAPNYTITQANVDAGHITNNVTASGLEPDGTTTVQANDTYIIDANNTEVTLCSEFGIELVKIGNFNNDNGNGCTEIDETITYTFQVTNTGDVALSNVTITDPLLSNATPAVTIDYVSGDIDGDSLLAPSETWYYTAIYLVTQLDIDATEVINTATVNALEVINNTNVNATSQTITELIEDTSPPNVSNCAVLDATIECSGTDNETIANTWNSENILALENCATDACDNNFSVTSDYVFNNLVSTCGAGGTITVTYTLTDSANNATSFTATLTLEDTTGPDLSACAVIDETIECAGLDTENLALAWNATNIVALETCGTDTCDVSPTNIVTSDFDYTNLITTCGSAGSITVLYTVTDDCGNASTLTAILTIEDTTAPTFTVPEDITIECDIDVTNVSLTGDVTDELDNCAVGLEAVFTDTIVNGECSGEATITRTWSLSDACNNTTTHIQTITVQDTTAPIFNETLPQDLTTECDAVPSVESLTATDNCSLAEVTFEEEIVTGSCIGDYLIVRTWTAFDDCNNENVHTQIITVEDNNPPTLLTPIETSMSVLCSDIPVVPSLVFEDSCSNNIEVEFHEESTIGIDPEFYDITRIWTVTDDCGNMADFTQTIAVEVGTYIEALDTERCTLDPEFDLFNLLSGDYETDGEWSVIYGNATLDGSYFDPGIHATGDYTFMYTIFDGPCQTEVELNITLDDDCVVLRCGEDDVVISKTVTANGDGFNDFFTITGVEDCDFEVEIQIFNRWGAEIYKSNNYKNNWNGFSNSASVGSSGNVPTGTYYYIVNLKNSGLSPFTGPIYVATNK